jgi:opacity protein-like surface antigen
MVAVAARVGKSNNLASGGSVRLTRKAAHLAGAAVALMLFGTSGALAQNCTAPTIPGQPGISAGLGVVASAIAGTASSVASSLGNESTAFFTQQTSAFVAGARAERPDQDSGGIWARQVGGVVDTKSETNLVASIPAIGVAGTGNCTSRVHQTYYGVQAGADVARLNLSGGWNLTVGLTGGYLESSAQDVAPAAIRSDFQVPFIGGYAVATNGGFFTDLMIRREFYNITVNQPSFNLHSQEGSARAWSVSVGAGYNFGLADGYFIEPSIGLIWSRTAVDVVNGAGPVLLPIGGAAAINDIESNIFRGTLRVGRNFTVGDMGWQPFGSASFFYEGAPKILTNFVGCAGCAFVGAVPVTPLATAETSRIGAFGQLSLGLAAQALNTGWVGFVRGDYRVGNNIEGWSGNAGLRYNFAPEKAVAAKMVTKSPVLAAAPYNWTGFYLGGHLGAAQGRGHVDFVGTGVTNEPYVAGYLAGGQFGYNVQYGPYVVGVEVDASKTNVNGTIACGPSTGRDPATGAPLPGAAAFSPFYLTCKDSLDWIVTAAARLGVVSFWSDRTLLYVKGGGAITRESTTVGCTLGPNNILGPPQCFNPAGVLTNGFTNSSTKAGGLVGLGSEFGLTREWSAKAELTYIWFGNRDVTATPDGTRLNVGTGIAEAKIGLNYRFGQAYPLVMKY